MAGSGLGVGLRRAEGRAPGAQAPPGRADRARRLDLAILVGLLALVLAAVLGARAYEGRLATERATIDLVGTIPVVGGGGWSVREIHVRPGETITLRLTSEDVTHGFLIPDLGIESSPIVPGTYQTVTIKAGRPGVYTYYCNVLCSHRHGAMIGKLIVEEAAVPPGT